MKWASLLCHPGQRLAHGGHSEMLISFLMSPGEAHGSPHIIFSKDFDSMPRARCSDPPWKQRGSSCPQGSSQTLASRKAGQSEQWQVWVSIVQGGAERAATSPSEAVLKLRASVTVNKEML